VSAAPQNVPNMSWDAGWLLAHDSELPLQMRLARDAQRVWANVTVQERASRLSGALRALSRRMDEIADLVVEENGKPRVEAIVHEVGGSMHNLAWLCRQGPGVLHTQRRSIGWLPHRCAQVERRPHGVVLVIAPWNFPLSIPMGQVAAALLAGNAVLLKPSEATPRLGQMVSDLFAECDLPQNLLTVIQGDGSVGAALIDLKPDKVCFTGSVATGRKVMASAARFPIPVSLELGGVDAMIVCDDADIELASSAAVWGATFNGGQVCASVERVLVAQSVAERFIQAVHYKLSELRPGRDQGRVTVERQLEVYRAHLADAVDRGLDVRGGGPDGHGGFRPTTICGPGVASSEVYRDESFGPLIAIRTFRSDDQAVVMHNASPFGLTASVFSGDRNRGLAVAGRLRAGLVSVNDIAASLHAFGELPWGGVGESGFGRSHGPEGLLAMTWPKVVESTRPGLPEFKRPWWYPYDPVQLELLTDFTHLLGRPSLRERARRISGVGSAAARLFVRHPRL
jgi:acyl-CoA reductase-like NAD-dependent aldehyde dehydrogenase